MPDWSKYFQACCDLFSHLQSLFNFIWCKQEGWFNCIKRAVMYFKKIFWIAMHFIVFYILYIYHCIYHIGVFCYNTSFKFYTDILAAFFGFFIKYLCANEQRHMKNLFRIWTSFFFLHIYMFCIIVYFK